MSPERKRYQVSTQDREERLAYLKLAEVDREVLLELHPLFLERKEEFLQRFYDHLLKFPGTRAVLPTQEVIDRARRAQGDYMERMLLGKWDEEFFKLSIDVGLRHQEIGLEPKWVVGAWQMYLEYWSEIILGKYGKDPKRACKCLQALHKMVLLALTLNVDAYYSKTLDRVQAIVASQRQAILELSTPVIEIWQGIVVLPLIGTIDSVRTRQIMENLLTRVVETQAEVAILDLTGVSVVDTAVANHLMKTVEAAELLGTRCILTGISPAIAQTLVHLGVDLGHITTCASLRIGLQRALSTVGMSVKKAES
jgi:rsbT co-antagonist protein RsbR